MAERHDRPDHRATQPTEPAATTAREDADEVATLRDLGLETMAGDRTPTLADWAEVEARAAALGGRRRRALAVAATVVLLAGVAAGVVAARSGSEPTTVAGPAAASGYVLPPADATGVWVRAMYPTPDERFEYAGLDGGARAFTPDPAQYLVGYRAADGTDLTLFVNRLAGMPTGNDGTGSVSTGTTSRPVPAETSGGGDEGSDDEGIVDLLASFGYPVDWPRLSMAPTAALSDAWLTCMGVAPSASPTGGERAPAGPSATPEPTGPVGVVGLGPASEVVTLNPVVPGRPGPACTLDAEATTTADGWLQDLRLVGYDEWRAFMERHRDTPPPNATIDVAAPEVVERVPATPVPTATVPLPDEQDARAAVTTAVERMTERDADGTYLHLEDGAHGERYAAMFDEAKRVSGATDQAAFRVDEIAFTSTDRAEVRFTVRADVGQGSFDVPLTGVVRRVDGRWVVSYDTVAAMLGRAGLPAPAPSSG